MGFFDSLGKTLGSPEAQERAKKFKEEQERIYFDNLNRRRKRQGQGELTDYEKKAKVDKIASFATIATGVLQSAGESIDKEKMSPDQVATRIKDFFGVLTGKEDANELKIRRLKQEQEILNLQKLNDEIRGTTKTHEQELKDDLEKRKVRVRQTVKSKIELRREREKMIIEYIGDKPKSEYTEQNLDDLEMIEDSFDDLLKELRF